MTYVHYFDVVLSHSFQSETEDFDQAFNQWAKQFSSPAVLRHRLLHNTDSVSRLCRHIVWSDTVDIDEES